MSFTLYAGKNLLLTFPLVTVAMGGSAAYLSGRALAQTWRPVWQIPVYMAGLAVAIRFCHFALFAEPFLSGSSFAVDFACALALATLGYRNVRARQMRTQYPWLSGKPTPTT